MLMPGLRYGYKVEAGYASTPTAAIAPERIEQNLDAALAEDEFRPMHMRLDVGFIKTMRFYWDAMDNRWKQWVIGYGPEIQQQLFSSLFNRKINYNDLIMLLVVSIAIAGVIISLFIFKPFTRTQTDPVVMLYQRFCKKLQRKGLVRATHEGPLDFAIRAGGLFPQQKHAINLITRIYINARYRSRVDQQQLYKMKQMIRNLKFSA